MKLVFLVITILINFFNPSLIKSEEKIFSSKNKIENIARKESITEEKTEIKKIHIVKVEIQYQVFQNSIQLIKI